MLPTEDRIEIILLCGREGYSQRDVAAEFNQKHCRQLPVSHSLVSRLFNKGYRKCGSCSSIWPPEHICRSWGDFGEDSSKPAKFNTSNKPAIRRHSHNNSGRFEEAHESCKWSEDDSDRVEICHWFLDKLNGDPEFLSTVMLSDDGKLKIVKTFM